MAKKTIFRLAFESDFRIAGLFCDERDYRLSWLINRHLGFGLKRAPDFLYTPARTREPSWFSVYYFDQNLYHRSFYLVNNRSNEDIAAFTNPAGLGFLLLVKTGDERMDYAALLKQLRSIQQLSAAYMLDEMLGSQKEPFLYDFELFVEQKIEGPMKRDDLNWVRQY